MTFKIFFQQRKNYNNLRKFILKYYRHIKFRKVYRTRAKDGYEGIDKNYFLGDFVFYYSANFDSEAWGYGVKKLEDDLNGGVIRLTVNLTYKQSRD